MTINHYKILQVPETATPEQIEHAYSNSIKKWQQLQKQQNPATKERTAKVIASIEQAYRILSDPLARANYNKTINGKTPNMSNQAPPPSRKLLYTLLIIILILLATIASGIFYIIFRTIDSPVQLTTSQPTQSTPPATAQPAISAELKESLEQAEQLRLKNANNPELKEIAKGIAEMANQNANAIINFNTQFLGAQAANQNITFKFMVIDGITHSQSLLSAYLTERFIVNNNDVCNSQQTNLAKGTLFTFGYYNTKNELIGSYYIDQQVCQSPATNRIIKRPSEILLNANEINEGASSAPPTSDPVAPATTDN